MLLKMCKKWQPKKLALTIVLAALACSVALVVAQDEAPQTSTVPPKAATELPAATTGPTTVKAASEPGQGDAPAGAQPEPVSQQGSGAREAGHKLNVEQDIYSAQTIDLPDLLMNETAIASITNMTLREYSYLSLLLAAQVEHLYRAMHNYDEDVLKSLAHPNEAANKETCMRQLNQLSSRVDALLADSYESKDADLFRLLDSFGHKPAGYLSSTTFWMGNYRMCLASKIRFEADSKDNGTKYCVAHMRHKKWPENSLVKYLPLEVAVCLPSACESSQADAAMLAIVQKLAQANMSPLERDQYEVKSLYCAPSEQSRSRKWWNSQASRLFVALLAGWLALQAIATWITYRSSGAEVHKLRIGQQDRRSAGLLESLSLANSYSSLFRDNTAPKDSESAIIDLRILDSMKVLSLSYILLGHLLMLVVFRLANLSDIRQDLSNYLIVLFNECPAFMVNVFLMITGLLITYLLFEAGKAQRLFLEPKNVLLFNLKRYLRIMPIFAFVVAYAKYIAKYTGSGPSWDYATTSLAPRRKCELEPWQPTLLLTANTRPLTENCVPPAWYLSSDMQFVSATPFFTALLSYHPRFGAFLIKLYILCSSVYWAATVYHSSIPELTPYFRLSLTAHGSGTFFLSQPYTFPMFRINSYLVGVLIGHWLFNYKQDKISYSEARASGSKKRLVEPRPHRLHILLGPIASLAAILYASHLAFINKNAPFTDKDTIRALVAGFYPVYNLMVALAAGGYIMLSATGYGIPKVDSVLNAPFWKPLSRLSMVVLVSHVEVITYIVQTQTQLAHIDFFYLLPVCIFILMASYFVGFILYLFIQAPAIAVTNRALMLIFGSPRTSQ